MDDKKVSLHNTQADKHEEFTAAHAERLLKYPGSVYREAKGEAKAPAVSKVEAAKKPE